MALSYEINLQSINLQSALEARRGEHKQGCVALFAQATWNAVDTILRVWADSAIVSKYRSASVIGDTQPLL
jgi:hypothetical protein